jgi:putative sterol carrier protein
MSDEGAATESATGAPAIDPSLIDANELAKNMAQASDEQLAELISGPMREQILGEVFRRMGEHFRAEATGDTDAVIHWRIGGATDGGSSEYETVIRNGVCEVHAGFESDAARVTFTIGGSDFLRLVTGNAAGPILFMSGKLRIEGDMMFAANAASLFAIPKG